MYDELIGRLRANGELFVKYIPNAEGEVLLQAADAIEELQEDNAALNGTVSNLIQQIEELSKRVPKSGVWREEESGYDDVYYECSVCGAGICTIDGDPVDNAWSYCPECGAKMTGVERLPEPPKEE